MFKIRVHEPFVKAAIAIALTAGFGYGAALTLMVVAGVTPGGWYAPLVQAHGHAQLFGWVGLFVLGMGLYFLPRLRGTTLRRTERLPWAFCLLAGGIGLRAVAQPLAGAWTGESAALARMVMLGSAALELAGMAVIVSVLLATERAAKPLTPAAPAYAVEPYVQTAMICLMLAFAVNALGIWNAVGAERATLAARYDQLLITLLLYGMAIPMTIVFTIRNLPLFMRLEVPNKPWRALWVWYAVALMFRCLPFVIAIVDDVLIHTGRLISASFVTVLLTDTLASVGVVMLNACILLFLVWLKPWRKRESLGQPAPGVREHFPDAGEYGRFELLIYSAFVWLVVACALDIWRVLPVVNERVSISPDAARHALMVGFITLLIFGMAARMVPGFSGKRGLRNPQWVWGLIVLGNFAALLRVIPPLVLGSQAALPFVGIAGVLGWCAVVVLAVIMRGVLRAEG